MNAIYLDHNSTTPIAPEVIQAMLEVYRGGYVNPASQHQLGQRARRLLEATREAILSLLGGKTSGMDADRLLFTSGGTEANNQLLRGLCGPAPSRILVSAIEHPSVLGAAEYLQTQGHVVERLPVLASGVVDVDRATLLLLQDPQPALVSMMLANNETGAIQPVEEFSATCRQANIPLICDAVQAVTKLPVSFRELGIAAMTVAPHKFHGPVGIGAIVLRPEVKLSPLLFGGFQQDALRPGTESLALAVGFQRALEIGLADQQRAVRLQALRDRFEQTLVAGIEGLIVNSASAPRLPNTLNVAFVGLHRQELLLALDRAGVCCSTGSACASGSSEPSPVLLAMGLEAAQIESSLRFSLGATSTAAEIDEASQRIIKIVNELRSHQNRRKRTVSPRVGG